MKKYTDGLVSKTYMLRRKCCTQNNVDNAQGYLDQLVQLPKTKTTEK